MIADIGEVFSAQKDGSPPTVLADGRAPGESGVSVMSLRYKGGAHFSACLRQHLIAFVSKTRIKCRLAGRALYHKAHEGSLAICPAGLDTSADTDQDLNALFVAVRPDKFALAAAEEADHGSLRRFENARASDRRSSPVVCDCQKSGRTLRRQASSQIRVRCS